VRIESLSGSGEETARENGTAVADEGLEVSLTSLFVQLPFLTSLFSSVKHFHTFSTVP